MYYHIRSVDENNKSICFAIIYAENKKNAQVYYVRNLMKKGIYSDDLVKKGKIIIEESNDYHCPCSEGLETYEVWCKTNEEGFIMRIFFIEVPDSNFVFSAVNQGMCGYKQGELKIIYLELKGVISDEIFFIDID